MKKEEVVPFLKGVAVALAVLLVMVVTLYVVTHHNYKPAYSPVTIDNPAYVTPQAGPSPTATPAMSADQAERWRKAGVTAEGGHSVSVK